MDGTNTWHHYDSVCLAWASFSRTSIRSIRLMAMAWASLVPSPLRKREEGVWTNVYRARVASAAWSARQSDARKKSHDYVSR